MSRGSIVADISACHAEDPGSIPGRRVVPRPQRTNEDLPATLLSKFDFRPVHHTRPPMEETYATTARCIVTALVAQALLQLLVHLQLAEVRSKQCFRTHFCAGSSVQMGILDCSQMQSQRLRPRLRFCHHVPPPGTHHKHTRADFPAPTRPKLAIPCVEPGCVAAAARRATP